MRLRDFYGGVVDESVLWRQFPTFRRIVVTSSASRSPFRRGIHSSGMMRQCRSSSRHFENTIIRDVVKRLPSDAASHRRKPPSSPWKLLVNKTYINTAYTKLCESSLATCFGYKMLRTRSRLTSDGGNVRCITH